jgi:hypothetical protein
MTSTPRPAVNVPNVSVPNVNLPKPNPELENQPVLRAGSNQNVEAMFARLNAYTAAKNWVKADQQNWEILKQVGERDGSNYDILDASEIETISCQTINRLDQFWSANSNGKFGYRAQVSVMTALGAPQNILGSEQNRIFNGKFFLFLQAVGWTQEPVEYPQGYFPRRRTEFPTLLRHILRSGCLS